MSDSSMVLSSPQAAFLTQLLEIGFFHGECCGACSCHAFDLDNDDGMTYTLRMALHMDVHHPCVMIMTLVSPAAVHMHGSAAVAWPAVSAMNGAQCPAFFPLWRRRGPTPWKPPEGEQGV